MHIACFYNDLHRAAAAALARRAPQAELVDTSAGKFAYWREVRSRWDRGDSLLIIEQDIEIGPGMIASLSECVHDWCCYAYEVFQPPILLELGFGCTKFSAAAQQAADEESVLAERRCPDCAPTNFRRWNHFGLATADVLAKAGFSPHVHGEVTHHHDYGPAVSITAIEPLEAARGGGPPLYWSPETNAVYMRDPRGPRQTWGTAGLR
jgi:hypothetical protein